MSGKVPVPLLAPYTSSKHAVMAFAGALRMELKMFGVHVVTCLPSFHRTPLLTNRSTMLDRVWASAPGEVQKAYGSVCHESSKRCCEEFLTDWAWDHPHECDLHAPNNSNHPVSREHQQTRQQCPEAPDFCPSNEDAEK